MGTITLFRFSERLKDRTDKPALPDGHSADLIVFHPRPKPKVERPREYAEYWPPDDDA